MLATRYGAGQEGAEGVQADPLPAEVVEVGGHGVEEEAFPCGDVQGGEQKQAGTASDRGRLQGPATLVLGGEPHEGGERRGQDVGLARVHGGHEEQGRDEDAPAFLGPAGHDEESRPGEREPQRVYPREGRPANHVRHGGEDQGSRQGGEPIPGQRVQREPDKQCHGGDAEE
jgi:hypothetical protein